MAAHSGRSVEGGAGSEEVVVVGQKTLGKAGRTTCIARSPQRHS